MLSPTTITDEVLSVGKVDLKAYMEFQKTYDVNTNPGMSSPEGDGGHGDLGVSPQPTPPIECLTSIIYCSSRIILLHPSTQVIDSKWCLGFFGGIYNGFKNPNFFFMSKMMGMQRDQF